METNDQLLWKLLLDGDKASFEQIYTRYFQPLYEYGLRKTADEELVKEAIQSLFVKIWINRKNISETDNVKYYLLAALKNNLINAGQKNAKLLLNGVDNPEYFHFHIPEPPTSGPDDQQRKKLTSAINQLTARQKEIIYLRYFEELPYEKIADLMDLSVKAAYKLNARALDTLKDILGLSKKDLLILLALYCGHLS